MTVLLSSLVCSVQWSDELLLPLLSTLGDTCIHLAAYNNNLKILELLLRYGANINVQVGFSQLCLLDSH